MHTIDINGTELIARGTRPLPASTARLSAAWQRLICRLTRVVPGMAFAVAIYSLFQAAGQGLLPLAALAGTAALVYLGTATLSASPVTAALDLLSAALAVTLAFGASDPSAVAVAFLAHALWGILRTALDTDPPHGLTGNWSAFSIVMAILVLLG